MNANLRNGMNQVNPLLMSFTPMTKIEEAEEIKYSYNDFSQITEYDMRTVGTRSLKTKSTQKGKASQTIDRKNEIDDSKIVK